MKIATWNINSIRARVERLRRWLQREQPDVLCLQETKALPDQFPHEALREVGFHAAVHGQKTYNGVAILSRLEPQHVIMGMGGADEDPQARLISAEICGVRILSAYFPNGRKVGTEEYSYKLEWMHRLRQFLENTSSPSDPLILTGDFNVATQDRDVAHPEEWRGSVLCHDSARGALNEISEWGLVDVFAQLHPDGGLYSWWDYRMLAFPKNHGLRIDHIFATRLLSERCTSARIDREERKKGEVEKPSDHAPVLAEFDL